MDRSYGLASTLTIVGAVLLGGCSAAFHRQNVDRAAGRILDEKQAEAGVEPAPMAMTTPAESLRRKLTIEQGLPISAPAALGADALTPIAHWPEAAAPVALDAPAEEASASQEALFISLADALEIAAANSREYQDAKDGVFSSALDLEFERDLFDSTFTGVLEGRGVQDRTRADQPDGEVAGFDGSGTLGVTKRLKEGAILAARIGIDLARMLEPGRAFSRSIFGDASVSIPLMRGAGRHIVMEPLTQAERNVLYAIWNLERFKQGLAVDVYDSYLVVLRAADTLANQEENYRGLITSTRRARRLAEAGKLPQIQVDQAIQDELRSRERWIASRENQDRVLDQFKTLLGLPVDARIELDRGEFARLSERLETRLAALFASAPPEKNVNVNAPVILDAPPRSEAGPYELEPEVAVEVALANRVDLQVLIERVLDAQRRVVVAADALRAEVTLLGSATLGERRSVESAAARNANRLELSRGRYESFLTIDLPFERTAEALSYRESLLALDAAVRDLQAFEDQVKFQVRDRLRVLVLGRASLKIQAEATRLAERRVSGAQLELEAGRAQMRDLLEAQESLVTAQNALTAVMVDYRIAELEMQRDLGVLAVAPGGALEEIDPAALLRPEMRVRP